MQTTHAPAPIDSQRGEMVDMRLRAWGATDADVERALGRAGWGWSRNEWQFAQVERLSGVPCPIDTRDPKAVAADAGYGWAYAVYATAVTGRGTA